MLVSNSNLGMVDKIVGFRAVSGEEIIGKLKSDDVTSVTISKPIIVHIQMMPEGAAISFAPFTLSREDNGDFTFYRSGLITAPGEVRDDIRVNYIKATTGLDVPPAGSILRP